MEYVPELVITHFPCSDGSTSAGIVKKYYENHSDIEYMKGNYSEIRDMDALINKVRGKHVLMVDFSFKPNDLKGLLTSAETIVILDHHISAQKALEEYTVDGIPTIGDIKEYLERQKCVAIFDMDECGSSLAWKFFYPDQDITLFVERVKDIDLGRHKLPNSREFLWFTRSIPLEPDEYKKYVAIDSEDKITSFIEKGKSIKDYVDNQIETIIKNAKEGNFHGVSFKWVITDYAFASEVANYFIREGYDIGICAYFTKDTLGLSFRSREGIDCSGIAESFGGGGHKQAAGANIPLDQLPSFLDAIDMYINTNKISDDIEETEAYVTRAIKDKED